MAKKGQVSNEFLFSIGIIVLVFLMVWLITANKNADLKALRDIHDITNECHHLSDIITGVYVAGPGASYASTLGFDASVAAISRSVTIEGKHQVSCSIPVNQVMNGAGATSFTLTKGAITITNTNNMVVLQNA